MTDWEAAAEKLRAERDEAIANRVNSEREAAEWKAQAEAECGIRERAEDRRDEEVRAAESRATVLGEENERKLERMMKLRAALKLARSIILSGEPMSEQAAGNIAAALSDSDSNTTGVEK